jgi:hypothetical protein
MRCRIEPLVVMFLFFNSLCFGQSTQNLIALADADSTYVRKFLLRNDFRFFYGMQGNNLALGSTRDADAPELNGNLYTNTNDYIGVGITYKWLDGDLSFSLPGTAYLKEERSNLSQFKLALSSTQRKLALRGYYTESKGVVVSGSENEFQSEPTLHEVKLGLQITYLFNSSKYSYRASMYQSEYQMKTAGSFLLRVEPFFRNLGTSGESMIPAAYDLPSRFGDQAGLEYIKAPGVLVLPGYGINIVVRNTPYFISPILFAGVGVAHNMYEANNGTGSFTNLEYAAHFGLNAGYNGSRYYSKMTFNWSTGYTALDPAYLTTSNLTFVLTFGIRFRNLNGL